ncbi:peroxide stress protein YaaA [Streptococcus dentapri]|uniref:UPF0246 protein ACFOSE_07555 n=1 Tax=Streptococcus dentapri TaxID=573564 RepID=A0ABV8D258_9STRE
MKFLIPTAKEMKAAEQTYPHQLPSKSWPILKKLGEADSKDLEKIYHIKPETAEKERQHISNLLANQALGYHALELFNGLMYRQIDKNLTNEDLNFIRDHVFITSALYGVINALDSIAEHRLDFNCKLKVDNQSLKNYWRPYYDQFVKEDNQPIISMLSSEFESVFSKKYTDQFIKLIFHEEKDGKLKTHSTISKKARGKCLNQIIKHRINNIEGLRTLTFDNFDYREELSTEHSLVFVKATD